MKQETAILAGGCYWGAQELIRRQPGVISTRVGWSGGETPNPTDDDHGDHAEAVEIIYDADATSYRSLLEFFFQIHDPTTLNRQGDEAGRYVRSAVFYIGEQQRLSALDTIADVDESGLWPKKVVTEVVAAGPFWEAQEEDQDYLQKHPNGDTCHFVRHGWKLPHRQSRTA
jgi:peptide-methionine (S)-S-oxide reductase